MDELLVPPALVLGCNTPHGIGVLSDWIEEHTGHAPDFADTGWSGDDSDYQGDADRYFHGYRSGDGYGYGNGDGYGVGFGDGYGYGVANGDGYGDGKDYGDGTGRGNGLGDDG